MSGPSRAEISELLINHRALLGKMYPGCKPGDVCRVYADVERRLNAATGSPEISLRELGRLLKRWIEDSRGQSLRECHRKLLAGWYGLTRGSDLQTALKRSRVELKNAESDPSHWLHGLLPQFRDGALLVA